MHMPIQRGIETDRLAESWDKCSSFTHFWQTGSVWCQGRNFHISRFKFLDSFPVTSRAIERRDVPLVACEESEHKVPAVRGSTWTSKLIRLERQMMASAVYRTCKTSIVVATWCAYDILELFKHPCFGLVVNTRPASYAKKCWIAPPAPDDVQQSPVKLRPLKFKLGFWTTVQCLARRTSNFPYFAVPRK